jgi:hypothetical protein
MSGAIPPLPNAPSWRGAQLKHRDVTFTFTFEEGAVDIGHNDSNVKTFISRSYLAKNQINIYVHATFASKFKPRFTSAFLLCINWKGMTVLILRLKYMLTSSTLPQLEHCWRAYISIKGKSLSCPCVLLTQHHAIKAYLGSGGIAPLIL